LSGYVGSVARAEQVELSHPYSSENVGFLVRDYQRGRFLTLDTLARGRDLTVAVPLLQRARDVVAALLPEATIRDYDDNEQTMRDRTIDALLMSLERAHYWSRVHPEFSGGAAPSSSASNPSTERTPPWIE
jgi:hypothetical protein